MILLTGASGFIGQHLLKKLQNKYGVDNVIALTSKPLADSNYLLHHNYNFFENYFVEQGYSDVDVIIHAGAFTPKNGAAANDWINCNQNIISTNNLLSADLPNLKKIIFLSTLDVYVPTEETISESTALMPLTLYGQSKLYCEKLVKVYCEKQNMIAQILRIGHTYGPGEESYQKLIPSVIKTLLRRNSPQIWSSGRELRSYIYIDDVVTAIINSLDYEYFVGEINVVSGSAISVLDIVKMLIKISSIDTNITFSNPEKQEISYTFNNSRLINSFLQNETRLEEGLKKEWEYMQKLYNENLF